jgi:hypothetical protein
VKAILDKEAHWTLTSSRYTALFDYPVVVEFFLFGRGEGLHRVSQVSIEERWQAKSGEACNFVTFHENDDGPNEFFQFPANCVWVAGEVEL